MHQSVGAGCFKSPVCKDGVSIELLSVPGAKKQHRNEIAHFAEFVSGDEVAFISVAYRQILEFWRRESDPKISRHTEVTIERFSP